MKMRFEHSVHALAGRQLEGSGCQWRKVNMASEAKQSHTIQKKEKRVSL
jgi:hypothetical protein